MNKRQLLIALVGQRIGKPPGWERVARFFAGPESFAGAAELCTIRDGMAFITQPSIPLGWNVAMFGTYEPELREILRAVLPSGGVAIDVGANVGWHTLLMASLVGKAGRVLAVEANPSVGRTLRRNVLLNRMDQVEILPYAMADKAGPVRFLAPDGSDPNSGNGHIIDGAGEPTTKGHLVLEARTLDSVVMDAALDSISVIKIDVEGYELPVLRGAEGAIARHRPHVVFEYVSDYAPRGAGSATELQDFFDCHDYELFAIGRAGAFRIVPGSWPACSDIWAVPSRRQ